jgi:hypothetical protein
VLQSRFNTLQHILEKTYSRHHFVCLERVDSYHLLCGVPQCHVKSEGWITRHVLFALVMALSWVQILTDSALSIGSMLLVVHHQHLMWQQRYNLTRLCCLELVGFFWLSCKWVWTLIPYVSFSLQLKWIFCVGLGGLSIFTGHTTFCSTWWVLEADRPYWQATRGHGMVAFTGSHFSWESWHWLNTGVPFHGCFLLYNFIWVSLNV